MTKRAVIPMHEAALDAVLKAGDVDRAAVRCAVLDMLTEDRRMAYSTRQPAVAVSASIAIAKLFGMLENAPPVTAVTVNISGDDKNLL